MTEVTKAVLTGGPCGGKTSAADFLQKALSAQGVAVLVVPEQATALMSEGKTPGVMGSFAFHQLLFSRQLAAEEAAFAQAEACGADKALVLCDRGLLDSRAYVTAEEFRRYSAAFSLNEERIRNRYDAVFHLVTAANGAQDCYNLDNAVRSEDLQQAKALDDTLLSLWVGTTHLRVIDNRGGFADKLDRLKAEVLAVMGIPEPLEIERKLLIEYPDLNRLQSDPFVRCVPITQAYMNTPEEGLFRVRKRGEGEGALYIKTVKRKISDLKRVEIERYISENEYYGYLNRRDCVQGIISKDRYCIVSGSEYFELDVYPFWQDRATLEIELLSEDQPFEVPKYLRVIRDVSFEKGYRNKLLAVTYGKLFQR